jgi:hypothetical protein
MEKNHGMTRVMIKRLCKGLALLAVMALVLSRGLAGDHTFSARLTTLWDAPQGPGRSDDASRWLTQLRDSVSRPRAGCQDLVLPDLSLTKPARAFQIKNRARAIRGGIANRLPAGTDCRVLHCRRHRRQWLPLVSISGRGLPFAKRDIVSPFPYARLPALASDATITAIVQDYKAIRPWIMLADETSFVRDNAVLWVGLGAPAASC